MSIERLKEMLDEKNNTKEAADVIGQAEDIMEILKNYFQEYPMQAENLSIELKVESDQEFIAEIPVGENVIQVPIKPKNSEQTIKISLGGNMILNEILIGTIASFSLAVGS